MITITSVDKRKEIAGSVFGPEDFQIGTETDPARMIEVAEVIASDYAEFSGDNTQVSNQKFEGREPGEQRAYYQIGASGNPSALRLSSQRKKEFILSRNPTDPKNRFRLFHGFMVRKYNQ